MLLGVVVIVVIVVIVVVIVHKMLPPLCVGGALYIYIAWVIPTLMKRRL